MNREEITIYWIESSDKDFRTMEHLYKSKDYSWSLFIGHLVIEKLLKAYYIKVKDTQHPFFHDLMRIIEKTELLVTEEQKLFFNTVTTFYLNARYEDYKFHFSRKCTPEYTDHWINQIKYYRKWIKEKLLK
ncbi:MAG: HEPN domain-containing protein [Bacteroidetes bacterium]|nr:HEPN domain-containing protein [Bacteroidota bacterium]